MSDGCDIACDCDERPPQPSTVIGNTGVVIELFDVSKTKSKSGVTGAAKTFGTIKDGGSAIRQRKPEGRALFRDIANDLYERFIKVVSAGGPHLVE